MRSPRESVQIKTCVLRYTVVKGKGRIDLETLRRSQIKGNKGKAKKSWHPKS